VPGEEKSGDRGETYKTQVVAFSGDPRIAELSGQPSEAIPRKHPQETRKVESRPHGFLLEVQRGGKEGREGNVQGTNLLGPRNGEKRRLPFWGISLATAND